MSMDSTASPPVSLTVPRLGDIPPPPRQPSPQARDLIFRYQGSQKALLIIGAAFTAMGLPFLIIFCWGLPIDLLIAMGSKEAPGTLTGAYVNEHVEINGENPLAMQYRYTVDGTSLTGESSTIDYRATELPAAGQRVTVEYATLVPAWSRVKGTMGSPFGWIGLMTAIFPVIGVIFLWVSIRSNRREIRAFTHGRPVMATVTYAGYDRTTRINHRHPYMVRWTFRADSVEVTGKISHMNETLLRPFSQHQQIPVLYLESNPKINTLYIP